MFSAILKLLISLINVTEKEQVGYFGIGVLVYNLECFVVFQTVWKIFVGFTGR